MPQLAPKDLVASDGLARQKKLDPMDIARRVNQAQKKRGMDEVDKSTIYRYLKGSTHRRGMLEKRGRKQSLTRCWWTWAGPLGEWPLSAFQDLELGQGQPL